jgi:hypothetical protein
MLQAENEPAQAVFLYPTDYCDGSPVDEVCTASGIIELNPLTALIYPNPAQQVIQVIPSLEGKYTVAILDISGRIITSVEVEYGIAELSLSALVSGNYFVKVQSGNHMYTEQLIKY